MDASGTMAIVKVPTLKLLPGNPAERGFLRGLSVGTRRRSAALIAPSKPIHFRLQVMVISTFTSTPERIRTPNLLIRSQLLYPIELRVPLVLGS